MPRAASVWLDVLPSMSEFRRELRQSLEEPVRQSAARAGDQAGEGLMQGMTGKMKAGALAAGAVTGALVAQGIQEAVAKQAATGKLKGQLGLSPKEAKTAGAAAGKLYANAVTESIDEGAAAVRATMAAGLAPEKATTKQLTSIATKVQDLSALFEVDLGQAANAAGQAVKTGLAKNGAEALDVMYRGFQVMGPRADDLADTFNEYSVQFQRLGLTAKQVTGLLAQGMKAGARDTDVVADALKEFTLEGVQGSTKIRDGFKAVGLPAGQMVDMISKGGPKATKALQMTLDALRAMENPTKRDAAATDLFGTKSEDLQKALLALDPSTAVDALGKTSGAAKKAGDDLRDNAGAQFEQFKRRALMGLGDAATKYAIPPLMRFGRFLNNDVLPPVKGGTMWLADRLAPAVRGTGSAVRGTIRWFKEWGIWLSPLAVLVGGVTLALSAQAIVTGTVIGVMSAYALASRGIALVTGGWAAAQATLNAVMALNPFVLAAIAVTALGVALVVAWQKSETFRSVVLGTWSAIQTGARWLWTAGVKPMVDGFMGGLRAVGSAASWLWTAVLAPTFSAIDTGARILATILTIVVFGPIYLAVKVLGAVFGWLWTAAIKPVLGWIATGATALWAGLRPVLGGIGAGLRVTGSVFKWLWTAAAKPALGGIVASGRVTWSGLKVVFGFLMAALRVVGGVFKWLWVSGVKPAMGGIKSTVSTVWTSGIKPVFDRLRDATRGVSKAFDTARGAIKVAWDKVKGIAKAPVKFIVDTVYNGGIVRVWNKVADAFGAPTLSPVKFASGGVLPGYTPGRDPHKFYSPTGGALEMSGGEAIMRPEFTRAVGSGFVGAMNRIAKNRGATGVQKALAPVMGGQPQQKFADGGIFGWVGKGLNAARGAGSAAWDKVKEGASWLKDTLAASARAGVKNVVDPLLKSFPGMDTGIGKMLRKIPTKIIDSLFGYSEKADKKGASGGLMGGAGVKRALKWARTQNGLPYQWGGNGNPSWDCSGFMSAIESVIRGQKPHRRWATGAFSGATAPGGWVLNKKSPFMIGITNAGVGHTAGTINGVNVESRGGDGVVVGSRARGSKDFLFTHRYGLSAKGYSDGGKPRPGEIAWVGERGPELVKFKGGEEVFNHRTSLQMAEGLGARGFAKGTSPAKARKDLPGDLRNFTKSLTGSAAAIARAATELAKDLRATGGSGKALAAQVTKVSAKLQAMAKQRDAVDSKLAAARAAATDQKKTAADFMGLSNLSEATSVSDVLSGMAERQNTVRAFEAQIKNLSKKGLNQNLIQQLVAMGPDSELAGVLSGASAAQIKSLNASAKSGAKLSTGYGRTMADAMYDAGGAASKGFLTGLMAQEKEIQKAMSKLGAGAVKAIRSKKGIDAHSPSRKGVRAGADLGAGVVAGMVAAGPSVESAAARLGAAAVPAGVVPVTSGSSSARSSGPLGEGPVYLVVEDGTTLRAYFSHQVDAALTDVRRSKRAGSKKG